MFKKLKDKIAEEVKISPQRMQQIQQFTQSVTDKLQQTGMPVPDDGLFSISEDDGKQFADTGFTNVPLQASTPDLNARVRCNSNSSIASDVSFLPRYEPNMNAYHIQSDLDVSASELEDNASTQSSTLGHVSKEQVHTAFQKAQMRYHKYRGRYTDLANHYKELERENAKMKSVLVETQDKAIRRVSELREQCSLSQKAKADLESALRTEIEEKCIVIDTLKQKIALLQNSSSDSVNGNTAELLTNGNASTVSEEKFQELEEKLQEFKANSIVSKERISNLQKDLDETKRLLSEQEDREKNNNLKFAKSKMDLHTELQNRDLEITNLKQDLATVKHDLETYEKGGSLKTQNTNLIEKCEALKTKCHEYESEMIKIEQHKLEIEDLRKQLKDYQTISVSLQESELNNEQLREKLKSLTDVEEKAENLAEEKKRLEAKLKITQETHETEIAKLQAEMRHLMGALQEKMKLALEKEYAAREEKLYEEFNAQLEFIKQDDALNKVQLKLAAAEKTIITLQKDALEHESETSSLTERNAALELNYVKLMDENSQNRSKITEISNQLKEVEDVHAERDKLKKKVVKYQTDIEVLENNAEDLQKNNAKLKQEVEVAKEKIEALMNDKRVLENNLSIVKSDVKQTDSVREELNCTKGDLNQEITLRKSIENKLHLLSEEMTKKVEEFVEKEKQMLEQTQLIAQLNAREKELISKFELLNEEKNELLDTNNSNVELMQRNQYLEEEVNKLLDDNNNLKQSAVDFAALKNNFTKAEEEHKEFYDLKHKEIQNITKLLDDERMNTNALVKKLEAGEELVKGLQEQLEKSRDEFQNEIENLRVSHTQELMVIQKSFAEQQDIIKQSEEHSKYLSNKIQEKEEEFNNLLETIDNETNMQSSVLKEAEILRQSLQAEQTLVEGMRKQLQEHERTIKLRDQQLDAITNDLKTRETEYSKVRITFEENMLKLTEENEKLRNEISSLNEMFQQLVKEYKETLSCCSALRAENDELHNNVGALEASECKLKEIMQSGASNVEAQEAVWQNEKSALETNLIDITAKNKCLSDKCSKLEEKLELAEREQIDLLHVERQLEAKQNRIDELEKQINEIEVQVEMHKTNAKKTEELNKELNDLAEERQQLSNSLKSKEHLLETNQGELSQTLDQLDELSKEVANLTQREEERRAQLHEEIAELRSRNNILSADNRRLMDENDAILSESSEIKLQLAAKITNTDAEVAAKLSETTNKYTDALEEARKATDELSLLKQQVSKVDVCQTQYEKQISDLEKHVSELEQERQFLKDEIEELKTAPVNLTSSICPKDYENLQIKLQQYKSIDQTNRSSIEFYENELQKVQLKNEKLNRKLDETLVTLNHCADLSVSTEVEYLKNVLYNYMLGKESLVLARVIAAVCKFDSQQTDAVLKHEQHKQTLLGQLGIL